jgi:hypothetical protein
MSIGQQKKKRINQIINAYNANKNDSRRAATETEADQLLLLARIRKVGAKFPQIPYTREDKGKCMCELRRPMSVGERVYPRVEPEGSPNRACQGRKRIPVVYLLSEPKTSSFDHST